VVVGFERFFVDRRDHADAALHLARAQPLDDGLLVDVELDPVWRPLEINLAEAKLQRPGLAWKFLLFVLRRPLLQGLKRLICFVALDRLTATYWLRAPPLVDSLRASPVRSF